MVGINSMVVGGLALAVPADDVQRFLGVLPVQAPLGVHLAPVRLRDGRPALVVVAVEPDSRAARAGLLVGDALLAADPDRLRFAATLTVVRGGVPLVVPIPAAGAGARCLSARGWLQSAPPARASRWRATPPRASG